MINTLELSFKTFKSLTQLDFEKIGGNSNQQLIFPLKHNNSIVEDRVSEQELRLIFIEEFKKMYPNLFYSIETPTKEKYSLGNSFNEIKLSNKGKAALMDMCIYKRDSSNYKKMLNIEFKYINTSIKNIGKDIFKLINEQQNGLFIHLLNNTNKRTFCNTNKTGIFNKLFHSFSNFKEYWKNKNTFIDIIILSLNQKTLIHRNIKWEDLNSLEKIFYINQEGIIITEIKKNGWKNKSI